MALPKGVKSPVDYTKLYMSNELDGDVVSEKKMTKKQMKKRDEIADAIGKKDMKKRYGDENVRYAIATKLAMKEDITDEALLIQDWNSDDIKFTEIETVDIIKAKPLKENRNTMGAEKNLMKNIQSIKGKEIEIPDNTRGGPNYSPIKPKIKDKNNFPKVKIKSLKDFEKEAKKVRTEQKSNWRDELEEDWQKVNRKDKTDGLSKAAVKAYRRENPGSKLQTAVTTKPSKLKKGSKSAKRRLSFCRRMKGMKKKLTSAKTRRDPDSRINKALRRWNC